MVLGHIHRHRDLVVLVRVFIRQYEPLVLVVDEIVAVDAEALAVPVLCLEDRRRTVGMTGAVVHAQLKVTVNAAMPFRILKGLQLERPDQIFRILVELHFAHVEIKPHEV